MLPYLIFLLVVVIYLGSRNTQEGFGFGDSFNSSRVCQSYTQAYLNSVGGGLGTGSVVCKKDNSKTLDLEFEVSLPETQATFCKEKGSCYCNDLFDCACKNGSGYPKYIAYIGSTKIGHLEKFRDGIFYLKKKIPYTSEKTIQIYYEQDSKKILVLSGKLP